MTQIWSNIETVMNEKHVTSYRLVQLTGVHKTSIYRLKNGETKHPRYKLICQIADTLGVLTENFRIDA